MDDYKNKLFSILGDSISTFEGISVPKESAFYTTTVKLSSNVITANDTWWGIVIEKLGGKLLVNNSISGSTVSLDKAYEYQSYGCSDERTSVLGLDGLKPDVIMVYLGTNDWGKSVSIKAESFSSELKDCDVFSNAYSSMLEKLKRNYPDAEIWCFTLAVGFRASDKTKLFADCGGKFDISEYCKAIRSCAEKYGCRLIELYEDKQPFETFDGFHPNNIGMKILADNVLSNII